MAITEGDLARSADVMDDLRAAGHAVSARYDRRRGRVVVSLDTGVELTFPTRLAQGLVGASPDSLADVEVSASGLGLHWPQLDADLYVPALMNGVFGSKTWMARELGTEGGRARTPAKIAASRANGLRGGRPRKSAIA